MEREFEVKEVKQALFNYGGDKARGPNGFNFAFIKAAWDVLKSDFCDLPFEFHRRGKLSKELNATFNVLIPKVPTPIELR